VIIGFMASLLGLGGITGKIQDIIKRVRGPIEKAIDWVISQAVKFAKKIGNKLGLGKDKKNKDNKSQKGQGASEKDHPRLADQAIAELKKIDGAPKDYKTLRQQKEAQSKQIEQDYTAKLKPGIKLSIRFDDAAKDEQDGDIDFEVIIAPNTTRKKAEINPAKGVKTQKVILGARYPSGGGPQQQVSHTGTMEDLLLKFRSEQLGIPDITAKDILGKCNYAMSNIRVQGVTKGGVIIEKTLPITNDQILSIFSSGKGMVARELIKLRVVEAAPGGQGTVKVIREAEMKPEIAEIAPELYLAQSAQIVVSQEDELKQFIHTKLGPTIDRNAYSAQLDKHSEQAIWQAIRTNDKKIAEVLRANDIHKISHLSVNIHSEREMCPVCAAASNYMIANLATEAPEIWATLQEKKADQIGLETNVTSTVEFKGSAPEAPEGTSSTTKVAPPTGHTRPQEEVTPERAKQLTQPLTTTIDSTGEKE
jgi:glutamine amidotransferase PdxT